jgi:uncharacterized protein YdaU (DUF1376 family)
MADLPDPLVPADANVQGLDGFMLNVQRLFSSELYALSTGDEFKAAVSLWGRAWLQTPPGSLPNDERLLAAFSGAGPKWKKVREVALRGFVECSDGRLYHKVLCEDVLNAARKRQAFRDRTAAATEARKQRNERRDGQRNVVRDGDDHRERNDDDPPDATTSVTSVQGQGQGQGQKKESPDPALNPEPTGPPPLGRADLDRIETACRDALGDQAPADPVIGPMAMLVSQGVTLGQITTILASEARRKRAKPIRTWGVWSKIVAERLADAPTVAAHVDPPNDPRISLAGGQTVLTSTVRKFHREGRWFDNWGARPGEPGCRMPSSLVEELLGHAEVAA